MLNDRGANGLLFSASESNNLHSLWDRCLPGVVSGAARSTGAPGFTPLAVKLKGLMTPSAVSAATTPGDHHDWPAAWVTDSLHGDDDSVLARIVTPAKATYTAGQVATAQAQLVKAAIRLAALFNAIQWP